MFYTWCLTNSDLDERKQVASIVHFIDTEAYVLVECLDFPESPIGCSYPTLKKILLQHKKPVNFVTVETAKFHVLIRSESQSILHCILQRQTLAAMCEHDIQLGDQLRGRLSACVNLPELQNYFLWHHDQ
ncbi:hypothetical protein PHET_04242 [Paragonimus heterotremus]|uniref:Uncharacterized protein n=1 Tax=Paragonimus heterotremus TaxID=100268 RepID=A0A8J4WS43_9TREM|nr:hypothetical protein PHET_04242 [Paragonimus heterotremus]